MNIILCSSKKWKVSCFNFVLCYFLMLWNYIDICQQKLKLIFVYPFAYITYKCLPENEVKISFNQLFWRLYQIQLNRKRTAQSMIHYYYIVLHTHTVKLFSSRIGDANSGRRSSGGLRMTPDGYRSEEGSCNGSPLHRQQSVNQVNVHHSFKERARPGESFM